MKIIRILITRFLKIILYAIATTSFIALLYSLIIWIFTPVYKFPKSEPFSGTYWYNPYNGLDSIEWYKAGFCGRSKTILEKQNEVEDSIVLEKFAQEGFEYAAITNRIFPSFVTNDSIATTPSYKFGYNIYGDNLIIIGAKDFSIFDYPLIKTLSASQKIINNLSPYSGTIIITDIGSQWFPKIRLRKIRGANLIDLQSGEHIWDYLLTRGKPLFLFMGNIKQTKFLMLPISKNKSSSLNMVLNSGSFYGIERSSDISQSDIYKKYPYPKSIKIAENKLSISLSAKADSIEIYGNNGVSLATFTNSANAIYEIDPSQSFVRIKALFRENPKSYTAILFNPIIRSIDGALPTEEAVEVSVFGSFLKYISIIILLIVSIVLFKNSNFAERMKINNRAKKR